MSGCATLILAGGSGARMGSDVPKQYLDLCGLPVLRRTVTVFLDHPLVDNVQVVIGEEDKNNYEAAVTGLDLPDPVIGGITRQASSRKGLESLASTNPDIVLIHDAARALIDAATIDAVISALDLNHAVLPGIPVADTLKRVLGDTAIVSDTIDRTTLWRAQTPQGFRFDKILDAHRQFENEDLTDDAAVAERAGTDVAMVRGNENNFKITTQDDLERAKTMMSSSMGDTRIGTGFDVHAFGDGDCLTLCGIEIDHEQGLEGHSDADVAMHAITDALLGAIAAGDIGNHFPPSDEKWRGAASYVFLEHAAKLISDRNGSIANIDLTIICETPKIGPHRVRMQESLASLLTIEVSRISVKATTTEKLGFTGRNEGIAAQAVAAVRLP